MSADEELLDAVSSRLDLREPNEEAVRSVVIELANHYDIAGSATPFEAVVDSATGMGKTYVIAGLIEYLAEGRAVRNFAIVTPGRTILAKTISNFTVGHAKSLLPGMEVEPLVITAENFASPTTRAAMEDESRVKLYIFTVQSLLKPTAKADRKTHEFQEGLGGGFYEHLKACDDLVVLADEHHCYYGDAFSDAVRDLAPWALIGLTATPHPRTPEDSVVFRYPLAAAIADHFVKTPVIVGRKDNREDVATKLLDGVTLLRAKAAAVERYCLEAGSAPVSPMMLVVAQSIEEAKEIQDIICSKAFDGGSWSESVLTVNSKSNEEALEALGQVEDPGSPVRIIIAVGMLKEGWDVKSVYVIASLRASVSSILTEQTLGRGMRLPWGKYTGVEMLDTLEVLAHERYELLLKKKDVLQEAFIDHRTRAVVKRDAEGKPVVERETSDVGVDTWSADEVHGTPDETTIGGLRIVDADRRKAQADPQWPIQTFHPRSGFPEIGVPRLRMTSVKAEFSLADVTDYGEFLALGRRIAADPDGELRRTRVSARVIKEQDGLRRTELVRAPAEDKVESAAQLFPLKASREKLADAVLSSDIVPSRDYAHEQRALGPILDAFIGGLGSDAEKVLSAFGDKASARLVRLVTEEARRFATPPKMEEVAEIVPLTKERSAAREFTDDRRGPFDKKKGYRGWAKSVYAAEWFDSTPERDMANLLDGAAEIHFWTRLHPGDLPILWRDGREYHPDFIAVETDGTHWVVEVKADRDMASADVKGKREAARRWAGHVNAADNVSVTWKYLLVSEADLKDAKDSWNAVRAHAS